jgi:hypothetical protein
MQQNKSVDLKGSRKNGKKGGRDDGSVVAVNSREAELGAAGR